MSRQEFLNKIGFNAENEVKNIVSWLKETMKSKGYDRVVIGLSGGIDSAVSAALAAKALGPENVIGVMMPYAGLSSNSSINDAREFSTKFGIKTLLFPIGEIVDSYFLTYGRVRTSDGSDPMRKGNICARTRMMILFDFSRVFRALVLGTENKSEKYLGYFTLHGDDASAIEPIQWYYKQEVYELAKYLGIPKSIIEKAPSAELTPKQTDEGELGFSYLDVDKTIEALESFIFEKELRPENWTLDRKNTVCPEEFLFEMSKKERIYDSDTIKEISERSGVAYETVDRIIKTISGVSFKHYLPTVYER